jgi:hypothetical protein
MCLIKIVVRWIYACKINENQVSMNKKQIILTFTK